MPVPAQIAAIKQQIGEVQGMRETIARLDTFAVDVSSFTSQLVAHIAN